jgi:hypothetical protein
LTIKQTFQMISGSLKTRNGSRQISGKLNGDQIAFSAGNAHYTGRVNGNSMEGTVGGAKWTATRAGN